MLRQLRGEKFRKWIMIGVIVIVVPSFVVFYGWQSGSGRQGEFSGVAGTIDFGMFNKREIKQEDLTKARQVLRNRLGAYLAEAGIQPSPGMMEQIITSPVAVREAVNLILLEEFARANGIVVSDDEVVKHLRDNIPAAYKQQFLDQLAAQGKTIDTFALEIQEQMLLERIDNALAAQTRVTYYEAWLNYLVRNEKLKTDYVRFDASAYEPKVKMGDPEIQAYFKQNREKFRIDDQVIYAYVVTNRDDLRSSVTVTNDDITSYYKANQEEYRLPDSAHVRQIFLAKPTPRDASTTAPDDLATRTQAVAFKANDIYQRIAKGEDFATLADKFTEETLFPPREDRDTTATDKATTAGGNLGFILQSTAMGFYGDTWTTTVFNMTPGSVHPPVETPRGFFIPRLESLKKGQLQPQEKVQDLIRDRLIKERLGPLFEEAGRKLETDAQRSTSLDMLARITSQTVRLSPKVDKDAGFVPGLGRLGDLEEAVHELSKGGRSGVLSDRFRHLVIEVREEFPEHLPELDEVREKVEQACRNALAVDMARTDAEKLKAKAVSLESMKAMAKDLGVTVTTSRPFTRGEAASVLGSIENFEQLSQEVAKGGIRLSTIGTEKEPTGYVVWHVAEKIAPAQDDFRKQLAGLTAELARKKTQVLVAEYLRDRWSQMGSKIKLNAGME